MKATFELPDGSAIVFSRICRVSGLQINLMKRESGISFQIWLDHGVDHESRSTYFLPEKDFPSLEACKAAVEAKRQELLALLDALAAERAPRKATYMLGDKPVILPQIVGLGLYRAKSVYIDVAGMGGPYKVVEFDSSAAAQAELEKLQAAIDAFYA